MKIKEVYLRKGIPAVSLTLGGLCVAVTALSVLTSQSETFSFTYPVKYPWQLVTYVFQHHTSAEQLPLDYPASAMKLTIGHLTYNLLLFLPYGILAEKVIGSKRLLLVSSVAWLVDTITMYGFAIALSKNGEPFICKGGCLLFRTPCSFHPFCFGQKIRLWKAVKAALLLSPYALDHLIGCDRAQSIHCRHLFHGDPPDRHCVWRFIRIPLPQEDRRHYILRSDIHFGFEAPQLQRMRLLGFVIPHSGQNQMSPLTCFFSSSDNAQLGACSKSMPSQVGSFPNFCARKYPVKP